MFVGRCFLSRFVCHLIILVFVFIAVLISMESEHLSGLLGRQNHTAASAPGGEFEGHEVATRLSADHAINSHGNTFRKERSANAIHRDGDDSELTGNDVSELLMQRESRDVQKIEEMLERIVLSSGWSNYEAVEALYELYMDSAMMMHAEFLITKALQNDGGGNDVGDVALSVKLADILNQTNRAEIAEALMLEVIRSEPTNLAALEMYRNTLYGTGREDDYFRMLEEVIDRHPTMGALYSELALSYADAGDHSRAEQILIDGISANPSDVALRAALHDLKARVSMDSAVLQGE